MLSVLKVLVAKQQTIKNDETLQLSYFSNVPCISHGGVKGPRITENMYI